MAGPTSFAPVIEMAMTIVEQSGGQYHVLLIIADGQVFHVTSILLFLLMNGDTNDPRTRHGLGVQALLLMNNDSLRGSNYC